MNIPLLNKWLAAITLALAAVLIVGCVNSARTEPSLHDAAHQVRAPYVDVAVNLGLKYDHDLSSLYDSLAAAGFRCGMRAMSLNAEQIVVEVADFDRAKAAVTEIIVRDKLTVRVYQSADFAKSPATSLLEVWERGQKTREEPYKLYFD
jgi:hypothetical protein